MQEDVRHWNNEMYARHPTPYTGLAGLVERLRVRKVCSMAEIKPNDAVLEVGCEAGNLLARLPECRRLVGVDISDAALRDAERQFRALGRAGEFLHHDAAEPLPFMPGDFSVILCSEMLEHVAEPGKVIENLARISTPETRIILTVPNEAPKLRVKSLLTKVGVMRLLLPGIEAEQSEWHIQSFSRTSLVDLVSGVMSILRLEVVAGLHIVALCRRMRGEGDDAHTGDRGGAPR